MAGSCKCGNGPLGSINFEEFLDFPDLAANLSASP